LTNPGQGGKKPAAMYSWNLQNERIESENYLIGRRSDFTATYMQVANLQYIIETRPEIVTTGTVHALCCVLEGNEHDSQRQVFFLFKKAADAIADIICRAPEKEVAHTAGKTLSRLLAAHNGHRFRAVAEAMGALPAAENLRKQTAYQLPEPAVEPVCDISALVGRRPVDMLHWMGRSAILKDPDRPESILVLKFARTGQKLSELAAETFWMQQLSRLELPAPFAFDIPRPAGVRHAPVIFRIEDKALAIPEGADIDTRRHAIAFQTGPDYFSYPNHPVNGKMPGMEECRTILARNAGIFGHLASLGIVHTAPIPLFHNRVQRQRRNDAGLYQWRRAGRLDQWLASCRFPNISKSGVRDFEHFIAFDGPTRQLYDHIGTHVLSLVLVAGSYCRNHDEARIGVDDKGCAVDARDLFDRQWLSQVLIDIFKAYYQGFTQTAFCTDLPFDPQSLSRRLIEEMGVDRHMEEILRIAEQEAMSDAQFRRFLESRGFDRHSIEDLQKDSQDIHILTGPHLGGFNQAISVPELIEYTAALSALCIMDRFCRQRFAA